MKIGDSVYVRGYVDEIRKDTVIIRNAGGYFGTAPEEIVMPEQWSERCCGYDTRSLILFGEACRHAGIESEDLAMFVNSCSFAVDIARKEFDACIQKSMAEAINRTGREGRKE